MANENKEKCFIITPIGEDNDPIRRHIDGIIDAAIKPALSDKYEVQAAHHISKPGSITKQVIEAIYNAKLVVANLTSRNPNVMYELALRHAIGKPVIIIVEQGTPVPSDIIMQRVVLYSNDAKGVLELQADLKKAESEISFDEKIGPIVEVLGDISHDADILKKAAEKNSDSTDSLVYIMQRLDRIESMMQTKSETVIQSYSKNYATVTYGSAPDHPLRESELLEQLSVLNVRVPTFQISGVRVAAERKEIYIYFNFNVLACPPKRLVSNLRTVLHDIGFTDVSITL